MNKTLENIGLALYWAEGSKSVKDGRVEFTNSDPRMIRLFMKFLREEGIEEKRLRAKIQSMRKNNAKKAIKYWSATSGIPVNQFTKTRVKSGNAKKDYMGCLVVRYSSRPMLRKILDKIAKLK